MAIYYVHLISGVEAMQRKRRLTKPRPVTPRYTESYYVDHSLDVVDGFAEFMIAIERRTAEIAWWLGDQMNPPGAPTRDLWDGKIQPDPRGQSRR